MMSTLVNTAASTAQAPAAANGGAAVQAAQTVAAGTGQQPAATAAAPAPAAAPFAQWLDQADGAAAQPSLPVLAGNAFAALSQALQAAAPADVQSGPASASADASAPAADARPAAEGDDGAGAQDNTLLAAMAMPLMPLTPMQIAQAVQVAQGGDTASGSAGGDRKPAGQAAGAATAAVQGLNAAGQDGGRRADIALAQLPAQAAQAARQDDGAVHFAVQAAAGQAGSQAGANAGADADARQDGAAERTVTAGTATATPQVAVAAPASAQPGADTVKLAGPPTAWRQSLQEALGDRLHVQVGKNVEQAVIRLEPPQLGRIDIAIRHSNGTLEVNISASNGEVLRQLQTVSDNLRNDLAQRQYTDVAVSVTPTPKNSGASPFGDPQQQQQGRGRQPGREQDEPGRALAEANHAGSAFSLGGREA
ncbi:flagellar hook-length control protein FliK [Herbaspirillum sp. SJZ107]|uniref:flagellar hook-length control protein FliK n=1 Tax=Herbaspirillum sp. SJZ107 TaxID=2572881 RepID=UPI0011502A93|nr:flagellar hook-length control protein FliK [Herbaspirillum sp. SJZ107]